MGKGESLGERRADHQRAYEAWATSEGYGIDLFESDAGLFECGVDYGNDVLLVGARSELGNHSAVAFVHGLRGDYAR